MRYPTTLLIILAISRSLYAEDFQFILSPDWPLVDDHPHPTAAGAFSTLNVSEALAAAMRRTFGDHAMRHLDEDHRLSPDDRALAVLPALQLLRVIHDRKSGSIDVIKVIWVGSLIFFDPWTGATTRSCTRLIEITNTMGESKNQELAHVIQQSTNAAMSAWLDAVMAQASQTVSPFSLHLQTMAFPGKWKRRESGCLVNKGHAQGIQPGMILTHQGRMLRITQTQNHLAVLQDALDPNADIPAGLNLRLIINRQAGTPNATQGKTVRLLMRPGPHPPPSPWHHDVTRAIFRDYLGRHEGLNVLPIPYESPSFRQASEDFRAYLTRFSDMVNTEVAPVSLHEYQLLQTKQRDLDISLIPLSSFQSRSTDAQGVSTCYQRYACAAVLERIQAVHGRSQSLFVDLIEQQQEIAYAEMPGVRRVDAEGPQLEIHRNALIQLATDVATHCANLPGASGPCAIRGTVQPDGNVSWESGHNPTPVQPLQWSRPRQEILDPTTGEHLGSFEQPMFTTDGLPLTLDRLKANEVKPGDVLQFNPLVTPTLTPLLSGPVDFPKDWPWEPWLHQAQMAQALSLAIPGCSLALSESANTSSMTPLWQSIAVEALTHDTSHIALQLAWRLRLGHSYDQPTWKTGKRLTQRLTFGDPHATPDLYGQLWTLMTEKTRTMADAAKQKQIPLP